MRATVTFTPHLGKCGNWYRSHLGPPWRSAMTGVTGTHSTRSCSSKKVRKRDTGRISQLEVFNNEKKRELNVNIRNGEINPVWAVSHAAFPRYLALDSARGAMEAIILWRKEHEPSGLACLPTQGCEPQPCDGHLTPRHAANSQQMQIVLAETAMLETGGALSSGRKHLFLLQHLRSITHAWTTGLASSASPTNYTVATGSHCLSY